MRVLICRALAVFLGLTILVLQVNAQAVAQVSFATPEEAATALLQALKSEDTDKLKAIFGPDAQQTLSSGDVISDRHDREVIALAMQQTWRWVPRGSKSKELLIGDEHWPFPIPLTKKTSGWQFDTQAGKEEVLARRIGRNELLVIDICRAYPLLQQEYASQPHDGKPAGLYAQKIRSTPGRQDGLYWAVKPGERSSPLGDLAADAAADGYTPDKSPTSPFWGYYFRILTAQGKSAPGGAGSYIVDGDMSGGFALIAYPSKYAYSGVMTFIVNQSGVVYEKDLGPETSALAGSMSEYNPDKSWKVVRE
jgi:hypothetical protein